MERAAAIAKRDVSRARFIPYRRYADRYTVTTEAGDYVQTWRVQGAAHESASDVELGSWHEQLHAILRTIASPGVALWSHVVRREVRDYPTGEFRSRFARQLNEKHRARLLDSRMWVNDLYVSLVYRGVTRTSGVFSKLLIAPPETEILHAVEQIGSALESGLRRYQPTRLGIYEHNGRSFSSQLEHFSYLVNGYWERVPIQNGWIANSLAPAWEYCGQETLHLMGPGSQRMISALGFAEYHGATIDPDTKVEYTASGQFNRLLQVPFEHVLVHSMAFSSQEIELDRIDQHQRRMRGTEDAAKSQTDQLTDARDDIASNRVTMGEHHFSLLVHGADADALRRNVSIASTVIAECGGKAAVERLGLQGALYAQLPGNFRYRPRPAKISSRNFAAWSPLHNFPSGKAFGNHWGPAVTRFRTSASTPFNFNFHAGQLGNTLVIGKSGTGKTVLMGFLLAQLEKFGARGIVVDKDRGAELAVRALGGAYYPLRRGEPTGFINPFGLEPSAHNVLFAQTYVRTLAHLSAPSKPLSIAEETQLDAAVVAVFDYMPEPLKRLGAVMQYLDPEDHEGVAARLRRWTGDGPLAWVADNPGTVPEFGRLTGFDITEFLDDPQVRLPVMMFLFHLFERFVDGSRTYFAIDEFWKALEEPYFRARIKNDEKTIRKQDGFLICVTQSPDEALKSDIAAALIEQTATKIMLANPAADHDDYVRGLKLSDSEFDLVRGLLEGGRRFVIKQGADSVVAELDLTGMDDELAILSGTKANVALCERIRARVGDDPDVWVPAFHAERKRAAADRPVYWPEYEEAEQALAEKMREAVSA